MSERDTMSPRQVVDGWIEDAASQGEFDTYNAKRNQARCSWHQPMELLIDNEIVYVQCRDISNTGVGLVTKRNLNMDQTVHVRRDERDPWIQCRVAHVTRSVGAFRIGTELAFDIDPV